MAAILRENEQMPWTEWSGASFVFAFLDSRLCKQIGKNADVLFVCGYIMGLTLRCRRYIFLPEHLQIRLGWSRCTAKLCMENPQIRIIGTGTIINIQIELI